METGSRPLAIGVLSRRTGCNVETIRYYERTGLLPAPPRSAGGYRLYGTEHIERLTFIRRARAPRPGASPQPISRTSAPRSPTSG